MMTFGQGLYNLTERDRSTLFIDSFFRSANATIPALSDSVETLVLLPNDRCLFINNISFQCDAIALATWQIVSIRAISESGVIYRIVNCTSVALLGDNATTSGPGVTVNINRYLGLLLPPGTKNLSFVCTRLGNTNAATATASINGYLVPPGGIGRLA